VQAASKKWNVPANIIAAEIQGESSWTLNAGDDTGDGANSFGLGQFIPGTAASYPEYKAGDAQGEIMGVAHFLHDNFARTGSWRGAIAAYNPGNPSYYNYIAKFLGGASYDKGSWELERDQIAQVHKGEMIIPKAPAGAVRAYVKGGATVEQAVAAVAGATSSNGASVTINLTAPVTMASNVAGGAKALVDAVIRELEANERVQNLMTDLAGAS
jgi:hypothetical protein